LIVYTPRALRQIADLRYHYEQLNRIEAINVLEAALYEAERRIERDPAAGLPAPRPYPQLARPRMAWVKAGRYWVAYRTAPRLTIAAVFYETADIPGRV
jgi:plasmid stabilization system protein ParE